MLTFRKYEKHVRTLLDQIVFDYFYLMKSLNLSDCDFTEFSSAIYTMYSESIDNIDFIIKIKQTLKILDLKEKYEVSDQKEIDGCNISDINSRIDLINSFVEQSKKT